MSKERYGIRRFALLNTAGYSLGLFPLEEPLSVYGANNLGKSASINALQFPILARMSDMSFGKYTLEQSRRFYFATDTSYILVDFNGNCMTPTDPNAIPPDFYPKGLNISKITLATCDGSTLQKWNAPANLLQPLPLKDIGER